MSTNGQLNGNGSSNGSHGLLNGNAIHSFSRVSKTRKLKLGHYIQTITRAILWTALATSAAFGIWLAYLQAITPKPPPDPRTVQIEKTIQGLYDAIDMLQDELPPEDEPKPDPR